MHPSPDPDPTWLLSSLVTRVPLTRSVLLLSSDGLKKAFHGLDPERADKLAAIASTLFGVARSAAAEFGDRDGVRQVVAELDDVLLFVAAAGHGAVLAVVANRGVEANVLGYEMAQLIKRVPSYLAEPARHADVVSDTMRR
jgi:predicted regulator of Ras-like GTPase activity (Roadblock/LC7/MglB family)